MPTEKVILTQFLSGNNRPRSTNNVQELDFTKIILYIFNEINMEEDTCPGR